MRDGAQLVSATGEEPTADALLSHVSVGMLLVDTTGSVRFASAPALRMLGIESLDRLPEELAAYVAVVMHRPSADGEPHVELNRPDGTPVTLEVTVTDATPDPAVRGWVLLLRDVTVEIRKRAALAASAKQYRTIVETALNGVWVVDADLVTTLANPKLAELLGCPDGIVGRHLPDFVFPEDLPALETLVERRRAGVSEQFEFRLRRTDGAQVWTLISTNPLFDDEGNFSGAFALVSDISEIKANESDLARRALLDPLTGLPNRTMFTDQLAQALARRDRHGGEVAVLFCDLDDFKTVNDRFGHACGDLVLREVAARLRAAVRVSDVVARIGGDEFVVLCEQVGGVHEASVIAGDVAGSLASPIGAGDDVLRVSASIGVAVTPQADPATLLAHADEAMYLAKACGRAGVEVSVGHVARYESARGTDPPARRLRGVPGGVPPARS